MIGTGRSNDSPNCVTVPKGVPKEFQDHNPESFSTGISVRTFIKTIAEAIRRKNSHGGERYHTVRIHKHARSSNKRLGTTLADHVCLTTWMLPAIVASPIRRLLQAK